MVEKAVEVFKPLLIIRDAGARHYEELRITTEMRSS
jgi:hypothetical protein